jgi:hypothetical protein
MNNKVVINGQEVQPTEKKKLPKGIRIADVVPPYQPEKKDEKTSG